MAKIEIASGIVPAHIESNDPCSYRLARRNGVLVLQGAFRWQQGSDGGCTWRDIPTVELGGQMTWQPIDTAPKDGTWILVWGGKTDEYGEWDKHEEVFMNRPVVARWRLPDKCESEEGYWQFANYHGGYYGDFSKDDEPTHWHPLPPLPEAQQ